MPTNKERREVAARLRNYANLPRYRKYRRKRAVMGNKIMDLEQLVADIIEKAHVEASEHCDGIRCDQCPFHVDNTNLAARGFVKELIYERGAKVVEE